MKRAACAVLAIAALGAHAAMAGDGEVRGAHGVAVLADWQDLPDVVARATVAAGGEVDLEVSAWGDTARGCYVTIQSVDVDGAEPDERLHAAVRDAIAAGATVSDYTSSRGAESTFSFEADLMRGTVRTVAARSGGLLRAATAACFYNPDSSEWCAQRCTELVQQLEVAP